MPQLLFFESLLDGILVGARERGEYEFAGVWVASVDGEVVAFSNDVDYAFEVAEVQVGVYALGVKIEGKVNEIHVAGPFSIAEQTALHAICAG
jgi:hypothetical protein